MYKFFLIFVLHISKIINIFALDNCNTTIKVKLIMLNYFMHPSNMRNQEKIIDLRINEHAQGYGVYIMIIERLRDMENYKMKYNPAHIAFAINEQDIELIKRVCENYGLFDISEDGYISSKWLCDTMAALDAKRDKAAAAAANAAAARWQKGQNGNASAMQAQSDGNASAMQTQSENMPINNINTINKPINQSTNSWEWHVDDRLSFTKDKLDEICRDKGEIVQKNTVNLMVKYNTDKNNISMLYEIAAFFRLTKKQLSFLSVITKNGLVGGRNTMELLTLYNKCKKDGFEAKYPLNYIISNLSSYKEARDGK